MFSGAGLCCFDGGITVCAYGRMSNCEIRVALPVYVQVFSILLSKCWPWHAGHGGIYIASRQRFVQSCRVGFAIV